MVRKGEDLYYNSSSTVRYDPASQGLGEFFFWNFNRHRESTTQNQDLTETTATRCIPG